MIITFQFLIAHTIADFIIQSKKTVKMKMNLKVMGFLRHALTLLLISMALVLRCRTAY